MTVQETAMSATESVAPTVTIRLFAGAAAAVGARERSVEARTVGDALAALLDGASEEAHTAVGRASLLLNAVSCRDHGAALSEGDRIDVLPPFAGG